MWIKCSDKLPDDENPVIGWNGKQGGVWVYCMRMRKKKREWYSVSGANHHQDITHWIPMPEPPK